MANIQNNKTPVTRGIFSTLMPLPPIIILAIEVDPTAGAKTDAIFSIGDNPGNKEALILEDVPKSEVKKKDNLYYITPQSINRGISVYLQPCKSGLLLGYDKKTGDTSFREDPYPTANLSANVHIFSGDLCLSGSSELNFEDLKKDMNKTVAGLNRILIRLDEKQEKIQDCIIDGVVYWEKGNQLVQT